MVSAQIDSVLLDSTTISVRGGFRAVDVQIKHDVRSKSIGDVLSSEALVFVKSNSGSALSTLSIRGGTPEQSTVFWNGLSLQNIQNGNVDLTLLPAMLFDDISLNTNQSTQTGSGNIAGSINIQNNRLDTLPSMILSAGLGSFGLLHGSIKATIPFKRSTISFTAYNKVAKNDYNYKPFQNSSVEKQLVHANFQQGGLLVQHRIRFKKTNPLNWRLWLQSSNRAIPATILEAASLKYQNDKSIRFQSDWSHIKGKNEAKFVVGSFYELLDYIDSIAQIYNQYTFVNNSVLTHFVRHLSTKVKVGLDIEARYFIADGDTFYSNNRLEMSEGVHLKVKIKKTSIHIGSRLVQYTNNTDLPLLNSIQILHKLKSKWQLIALVSNNYRMPTFNSLYWNPGGNPNLTAERSTNSELIAKYKNKSLTVTGNIYSNTINDQIRWLPGSDGIFTAQQVANQVQWNRGIELGGRFEYKSIVIKGNLGGLRSTVVDDSMARQQTFVPQVQRNFSIRYNRPKWTVSYTNQFVSKRFTDVENTNYLPSVFLHQATFTWRWELMLVSGTIQNIGNLYYTILPFRPNPPRNFELNVTYEINQKNKK
ncbi:MAG: vitamin B12 transporter [Bacteroidia bacterium]|jgi:vitamin B12 transporter